ncbi:batten's disease protein Cln3 [Cytidiella melzeri]|nr:batten's disease protein Cln3 [Cytidiella melzeri]
MVNTSTHPRPPSEAYELDSAPQMNNTAALEHPASPEESGPEDHLLAEPTEEPSYSQAKSLFFKLGLSFFLFGLINNVLYVIILSAALDLVPPSTPKGIIAFCNIFPALLAKIGWPYILKGKIRYAKRLIGCCVVSVSGMIVVASFDSLIMRLLGICLASFSSGLGELTFLQLSTRYHPPSIAGHSVGYFASGTGAAGLVGASMWWVLRGLGVRIGVGISSVMPLVIPLAYYFILPQPEVFASVPIMSSYEEEDVDAPYTPLPADDDMTDVPKAHVALSFEDKWELVKPLLLKYMLPLFAVYTFEYTINQGIAPTLVYPVPSPDNYWLLSKIIKSIRDYYPLWQLVYQTTVFFSRSSISLGILPLPARLLPAPAFAQALILALLAIESGVGIFSEDSQALSFTFVFLLISIEGICGGLAYVNVFYRINQEQAAHSHGGANPERAKQEREFKIGSIGFADSTGILLAAILAVPTEVELCNAQAARGKLLCKSL